MADVVWVIDDCPMTIKIAKVRLRSLGVRGFCMPTGRSAVSAWVGGVLPKPIAMLIDLSMQSGDGLSACRLLRDAGYTGLLLLHTNAGGAAAVEGVPSMPFDGVVVKPAGIADYTRIVESARAWQRRRAA